MPMAQCQTEGKNHHTATGSFDLYAAGLFATKLHTTTNGVTDHLDRFQGGVKYNSSDLTTTTNYATTKPAPGSNVFAVVKEDGYNRVPPHGASCTTTFTDDNNFKIRTDAAAGKTTNNNNNMGKAEYPADANVTSNARTAVGQHHHHLQQQPHLHAPPAGADHFRGISVVHNVAASFQKMGLDKSGGYAYSRGFYAKDTADPALALWGRPEVEIPKDDSSCFITGPGFSSSGDRSSHSSGELTSSDSHSGVSSGGGGSKDLDLASWSGRSSNGKGRGAGAGGGSLKAAVASPTGESPNAGSSSGGSTSGGSSIDGSPTVVRTSSTGNLFTNGISPSVARGSGSSRGSSTDGSPTSSRNSAGLHSSRSLNDVGTTAGFAGQQQQQQQQLPYRSSVRDRTGDHRGAFTAHSTFIRSSGDGSSNTHFTSSHHFSSSSGSSGGSRDRGDDSPYLEISSGVSVSYSRNSSSSDEGITQAPRKSTSDLPPPTVPASRHVRQPSLGVGFYSAGTSTSKSSADTTSPSGGHHKAAGGGGVGVVSPTIKTTSPASSVPAPRSPSESVAAFALRANSSDTNPLRTSSDAGPHGSRYSGLPAPTRSGGDVSSSVSPASGGASGTRYTSDSSPTAPGSSSGSGMHSSAGIHAPRVAKELASNGNIYQKAAGAAAAAPARSGSDVSPTGNVYPGKMSQSTSPAGGAPPPLSRHGSEVGTNGNLQSGVKPGNGLSANGFCVGGNFCGVTKTPTGVIHNGGVAAAAAAASGKTGAASNAATLNGNGKNLNGRVLNSGIITGGNFGSTKRDTAQAPAPPLNVLRSSTEHVMITKGLSMMDPEELKNLGNDLYKKGQFVEALSLYDRAIVMCPDRAPYRSNKAAALTGLGRLAEAERECKEAIRLDPSFTRAHQRLGSIYLRLGRVEDSKKHFKLAGHHTERGDIQKMENIEKHVTKCLEAERALDWSTLIKESEAAVAAGADFAPQILAFKAEALLKLHRLDEADTVLKEAQKMEALIGRTTHTPADTHILVVQAQIDMALGRFEDATKAAEQASHLDPYNLEILTLLKRARAVGSFRHAGNDLFNAGRFVEATSAYAKGLQMDPANAVLLCNRAACRLKLGQWEKAVEDCNAALDAQPQYTKALLRRASCYAKLERWEDSRRDYEVVRKRCPTDADVARKLYEVEVELKNLRGEDSYKVKFGVRM